MSGSLVKWVPASWAIEFEGRIVTLSSLQEAMMRVIIGKQPTMLDLAEAVGTTENTVRVELYHLRKKLRAAGLNIEARRRAKMYGAAKLVLVRFPGIMAGAR